MYADERSFDRFNIEYLTKYTPPLEAIDALARISDAIKIICTKNYSQLPIIQKNDDGMKPVSVWWQSCLFCKFLGSNLRKKTRE